MKPEFEKSNGKKIAIILFFLNSSAMLLTGGVVFNKDLFIWVRVKGVCYFIFWYINMPIMGFFSLIIVFFLVRLLIIMIIKLLCLIPAVDRMIEKENLYFFKN
uniref:Uncharacterized protein n=1 Tax=Promethearchaeum syntrophicum TaxID=2594042 RepID=A0A5B9DG55_9ARCH|nr:hypothetical protein DSAG12_03554 [Candidatus Prometheoarchaeum syntrophicum]